MLAKLRGVTMQHKVGKQRAQTCSVDADNRFVASDQAEITKQPYVQRWHRRRYLQLRSTIVLWLREAVRGWCHQCSHFLPRCLAKPLARLDRAATSACWTSCARPLATMASLGPR